MSDSFVQASCASAGAVFSTTALYPLEICKAKLVTSVGDGAHKTTASILSDVLKQRGGFGLYVRIRCCVSCVPVSRVAPVVFWMM